MTVLFKAYPEVRPVDHHLYGPGEWCEGRDEGDHMLSFAYGGFERSYSGLPDPERRFAFQSDAKPTNIGGRCLDVTGLPHESREFSYGGYNEWRDQLSRAFIGEPAEKVWADPEAYADAPFVLLVHFADNEGCIGPEACRKLHEDFEHHAGLYPHVEGVESYDRSAYGGMRAVFRHAAPNGFVVLR